MIGAEPGLAVGASVVELGPTWTLEPHCFRGAIGGPDPGFPDLADNGNCKLNYSPIKRCSFPECATEAAETVRQFGVEQPRIERPTQGTVGPGLAGTDQAVVFPLPVGGQLSKVHGCLASHKYLKAWV